MTVVLRGLLFRKDFLDMFYSIVMILNLLKSLRRNKNRHKLDDC